jgi:hypothetical protein
VRRHALPATALDWEAIVQYRATAGAAWGFVVAAAVIDVVTTWVGLASGLPETNPVAATAVTAAGPEPALVRLKLAALGVVAIGWRVTPPPGRLAILASVGLLWFAAGLSNVVVLAVD